MIRVETSEVDADVREQLERAVRANRQEGPRIVRLMRRASMYYSSYPIDELDAYLEDGRYLQLILKDLNRRSQFVEARRAKPGFLYNPMREIETYRRILAPYEMSSPRCYGAVCRPERDRYWLLIERVAGQELFQIGDFGIWQQVAEWLAGMHARFSKRARALRNSVPLVLYDRAFYQRWLTRAREFAAGTDSAAAIETIARSYDRVVDQLLTLSDTFLHGEFYASNVLLVTQDGNLRVCPVDWELAAVGPGLIDLAALIAGGWSQEQKRQLALAYYQALPTPRELEWEQFLVALDCCRLHIAMQWLGWSADWSPPPEHSYDWLSEAILLAEGLES